VARGEMEANGEVRLVGVVGAGRVGCGGGGREIRWRGISMGGEGGEGGVKGME